MSTTTPRSEAPDGAGAVHDTFDGDAAEQGAKGGQTAGDHADVGLERAPEEHDVDDSWCCQ